MRKEKVDVTVIGGGPAGMAAALESDRLGKDTLLIERNPSLGGILQQCIHDGFGLQTFKEQLSGPQYAERYIDKLSDSKVKVIKDTMVTDLKKGRVVGQNPKDGMVDVESEAIILAMGCRERTRNQIFIPGSRPSGVMTAGKAQYFLNLEGYLPGKKAVILGSGDIGLIMARRMHLEGIDVEGVYEVMDHPGGLQRNIEQCLHDYNIPLHLSTTVTQVYGKNQLKGVEVCQIDEKGQYIESSKRYIPCDLLVLSVGLIPENELSLKAGIELSPASKGPFLDESFMTSVPGIFACGNVAIVYDLVDYVSQSAEYAAKGAVNYIDGKEPKKKPIPILPGDGVGVLIPNYYHPDLKTGLDIYLRVKEEKFKAEIRVSQAGNLIKKMKQAVVRPAQMVVIHLNQEDLSKISGQEPILISMD